MKHVFISYSKQDAAFRDALAKHLQVLQVNGFVTSLNDSEIVPGSDWSTVIDEKLAGADIVILLVSADLLASKYCQKIELNEAMSRWEARQVTILPVLVRACDWQASALARLQVLPKGAVPVNQMADSDQAWAEIARRVRALVTNTPEAQPRAAGFPGGSSPARTALLFAALVLTCTGVTAVIVKSVFDRRVEDLLRAHESEKRRLEAEIAHMKDASRQDAPSTPDPSQAPPSTASPVAGVPSVGTNPSPSGKRPPGNRIRCPEMVPFSDANPFPRCLEGVTIGTHLSELRRRFPEPGGKATSSWFSLEMADGPFSRATLYHDQAADDPTVTWAIFWMRNRERADAVLNAAKNAFGAENSLQRSGGLKTLWPDVHGFCVEVDSDQLTITKTDGCF